MALQRHLVRIRRPGNRVAKIGIGGPRRVSPSPSDPAATRPRSDGNTGALAPLRWLRFEAELTGRLIVGDLGAALVPGLAFTAAACAHYGVTGWRLVSFLATSLALAFGFTYVALASNQAVGADEDRINKPHRPIPMGMTTPAGLLRRFWSAVPAYLLLGWLTGTIAWVALWLVVVIGSHLVAKPRHYLYAKPIAMFVGTIAQLVCFWELVGPIDGTGWTWILVLASAFNLALRYEDVRDIDGDRQLGRTTLPMLIGHWPVRLWFAVVMAAYPIVLHVMLFAPSPASAAMVLACDVVIAAMSWTCVFGSLFARTNAADRRTYMLYSFTYAASVACGAVLLWPA